MASSLTVTDNADKSGVSFSVVTDEVFSWRIQRATVTASAIGSYANAYGADSGSETGRISGTGYYYWKLVKDSDSSLMAGPVYQPATEDGDSVHERCLTMLQDKIDDLELDGLTGGVYIRQMGEKSNISFPCILLAIAGMPEEDRGGSIMKDDIGYPVEIIIAEACAADADARRSRHLMWRDTIRKNINNKRWDLRVPEVWNVQARFGPVINIPQTEEQTDFRLGGMTAVCVARQTRA